MFRNSQLSHILLLVVIGVAIYYLTCPKKTIKNTGTLEQITSESSIAKSESSEESVKQAVQAKVSSEEERVSEVQVTTEEKGIVSEVEEQLNKQTSESETKVSSEEERPTHSFKPNETEGGAALKKAFGRPVPEGTNTNSVDFNRNYLKKYDSKNYLPQEVNDEWFDTDFTQAKAKIGSDKLINTEKYVIGVDTVGQSLKNASYDLRGTVANPKFNVSPWNNSTYEPDYNIKPLC
jgi:cytoskeletal protein RodZ